MGFGKEFVMNEKLADALNEQINKEMFSAYLYLSMSAYCASIGLTGFANWMRVQYDEEFFHATKIFNYLIERGHKVELKAIEKPENNWSDIINVFEATYKHEQFITSSINKLMYIAFEVKDYAAQSFLSWYINEQVEEEANADELLKKLQLIKGDYNALLNIDKDCAARVFVPPSA